MTSDSEKSTIARAIETLAVLGVLAILFLNLGANTIWTPNEAFYAEAVREMHEQHNYLDIYYNYEPRLRKPPVTYWLPALSTAFLGNSEFALRLPTALCALGTVILTFLLGCRIHNRATGFLAALAQAFSLQFVGNARYASPEVPLSFFFALTLFCLYEGYHKRSALLSVVGYLALTLTVLTKGHPFLILIAGIWSIYLWLIQDWNGSWLTGVKRGVAAVLRSSFLPGIAVALLLSGIWYWYTYQTFGEVFLDAQIRETWTRAFHEKDFEVSQVFFYFITTLWGFLPYSLVFYLALFRALKDLRFARSVRFELIWFAVTILLFTIARGKIPTYLIPAHPAMALMAAAYLTSTPLERWWHKVALFLPGILFGLVTLAAPFVWDLPWWLGVFAIIPFLLISQRDYWKLVPHFGAIAALGALAVFLLPSLESFRPYREIGDAVRTTEALDGPLMVEDRTFHNLPFYAHRKVRHSLGLDEIAASLKSKGGVALIKSDSLVALEEYDSLWEGKIYTGKSESRFGIFLKHIYYAQQGDFRGFTDYALVRVDAQSP